MRTLIWAALLTRAAAASALAQRKPAPAVDIQTICRVDKECRVKVTVSEGDDEKVVVTTFRANRVGSDMKYIHGEEFGSADFPNAGLMYLDSPIVLDEAGVMQAPPPGVPADSVLTFTTTVGIDPHGHVTFFYGFIHGAGHPLVMRSYLWGYPPTTVKTIGAIGGPRSPKVAREFPPPRVLKGGARVRFRLDCDAENRCRLEVGVDRGTKKGSAVSYFRANRVGEDLRYFPAEKEGGTDLLTAGAEYHVSLDVVVDESGAINTPKGRKAPGEVEALDSIIALDDHGHVTFFYGFLRNMGSSTVRLFRLWGYSPETLMVDDAPERGGAEKDAARPRGKGGT